MREASPKIRHGRVTATEGDPRRACKVGEESSWQDPSRVNFYGYDFFVSSDVLTPRPETEQIIDEVLKLCGKPILPGVKPGKPILDLKSLKILDVGTGSGCIAIALKKKIPEAEIYASDISEKALKVAQKNAEAHNTPITFIISHLCQNVNFTPDIIVANLPYVDRNWDWLDQESLKSDPDLALYAEDGGLALIKELIDTATSNYLILEADESQHAEIIDYTKGKYKLINETGFALTFIKK